MAQERIVKQKPTPKRPTAEIDTRTPSGKPLKF